MNDAKRYASKYKQAEIIYMRAEKKILELQAELISYKAISAANKKRMEQYKFLITQETAI